MSARFVTLLSFTRTHTASLTMPVLIIAALISGYSYWYVLLFAVFAYLFHASGFVLNNILDYKWDKTDPNKQHFPLVTGEINYVRASIADVILILVAYAFGFWIIGSFSFQIVFMTIAFLSGITYNIVNKVSNLGPALISISFSFLIPYVMWGHGHTTLMWLYTVFAFITLYYQIGVSGYIKDIDVKQYNFMKQTGMRLIAAQIVFSGFNRIFATALRLGVWLTGFVILLYIPFQWASVTLFIILQVVTLNMSVKMLKNYQWDRPRLLKLMSGIEIVNYFSLAVLLEPMYNAYWCMFLIVFPILWFMGFNRLFFGTTAAPNV